MPLLSGHICPEMHQISPQRSKFQKFSESETPGPLLKVAGERREGMGKD